jgi:hypothetical protein
VDGDARADLVGDARSGANTRYTKKSPKRTRSTNQSPARQLTWALASCVRASGETNGWMVAVPARGGLPNGIADFCR